MESDTVWRGVTEWRKLTNNNEWLRALRKSDERRKVTRGEQRQRVLQGEEVWRGVTEWRKVKKSKEWQRGIESDSKQWLSGEVQRVGKSDFFFIRKKSHFFFIRVASHPSRPSLCTRSALWQWQQETPTGWRQTHRSHRQPWARSVGRVHITDTHSKESWEFWELFKGLTLCLWDRMTCFWLIRDEWNNSLSSVSLCCLTNHVYDGTRPVAAHLLAR